MERDQSPEEKDTVELLKQVETSLKEILSAKNSFFPLQSLIEVYDKDTSEEAFAAFVLYLISQNIIPSPPGTPHF